MKHFTYFLIPVLMLASAQAEEQKATAKEEELGFWSNVENTMFGGEVDQAKLAEEQNSTIATKLCSIVKNFLHKQEEAVKTCQEQDNEAGNIFVETENFLFGGKKKCRKVIKANCTEISEAKKNWFDRLNDRIFGVKPPECEEIIDPDEYDEGVSKGDLITALLTKK